MLCCSIKGMENRLKAKALTKPYKPTIYLPRGRGRGCGRGNRDRKGLRDKPHRSLTRVVEKTPGGSSQDRRCRQGQVQILLWDRPLGKKLSTEEEGWWEGIDKPFNAFMELGEIVHEFYGHNRNPTGNYKCYKCFILNYMIVVWQAISLSSLSYNDCTTDSLLHKVSSCQNVM